MVEVPENYSMNPDQMAQMQYNPLQQYMRQASIYIKLPSIYIVKGSENH